MHDDALARLAEDMLRHGVAEEAPDVGLVQAAGRRDLSEGRFRVDGEGRGDLEAADGLHADQFVVLVGHGVSLGGLEGRGFGGGDVRTVKLWR